MLYLKEVLLPTPVFILYENSKHFWVDFVCILVEYIVPRTWLAEVSKII